VAAALGWGGLAASSLVLGAMLTLVRRWPDRAVGLTLAFGAGALISAIAFELALEGAKAGGPVPLAVGLGMGAVVYFVLDSLISRRTTRREDKGSRSVGGSEAGAALALGAFLDGIPEQLVLGLGLAAGEGVSLGLLVAIFVSNMPEAIGSASEMLDAGRGRGFIVRLWLAVAFVCALASLAGYALAASTAGNFEGWLEGFAAGALLVMLVDSMIPDATSKAGRWAGLATTLGFAVAAGLSAVS